MGNEIVVDMNVHRGAMSLNVRQCGSSSAFTTPVDLANAVVVYLHSNIAGIGEPEELRANVEFRALSSIHAMLTDAGLGGVNVPGNIAERVARLMSERRACRSQLMTAVAAVESVRETMRERVEL